VYSSLSIVLGELYVGINRVLNKPKHLKMLHSFLELSQVIAIDEGTAIHYGEIVALLYKKGKPIPTNDVWIAAIAKQYELTLVTRDKHFNEIDDLRIKKW
jgi:tRNA(fMet)-specific endonuclease VapC